MRNKGWEEKGEGEREKKLLVHITECVAKNRACTTSLWSISWICFLRTGSIFRLNMNQTISWGRDTPVYSKSTYPLVIVPWFLNIHYWILSLGWIISSLLYQFWPHDHLYLTLSVGLHLPILPLYNKILIHCCFHTSPLLL